MDPVDDCHQRPQGEVLRFRGQDATDDTAAPEALEDRSEERTVAHVDAQRSKRPAAGKAAEQAHV
jgi:hypothetical protein